MSFSVSVKCGCSNLLKAINRYILKTDEDLREQLEEAGYSESAKLVDSASELEEILAAALENQRNYILAILEEKYSENCDIEVIMDEVRDQDGMVTDISVRIGDVFAEYVTVLVTSELKAYEEKFIEKTVRFIGLRAERLSNRATDWIFGWSEKLAAIMQLNSHDSLNRILSEALKNGESVDKVTFKLMDAYSFSRARARATAITEMLTAHSVASQEAMSQSSVVDRKEWRHTGSNKSKPRQHHIDMDGIIIGKEDKYIINAPSGIYEANYPRDPSLPAAERVNCHCLSRGIVKDNTVGMDYNERRELQRLAVEEIDEAWEKEIDQENRKKAGRAIASLLANSRRNLPDNVYYAGKVKPEEIPDALDQCGDYIRTEEMEHMYFFDDNGNIYHALGDDTSVTLTGMDHNGAYIVHNHPESNGILSFGKDDFIFLQTNSNIAKLVAVNRKYTYTATIKKDISKLSYSALYTEAMKKASILNDEIDFQHEVFNILQERGYIQYERKTVSFN